LLEQPGELLIGMEYEMQDGGGIHGGSVMTPLFRRAAILCGSCARPRR
jgi:hypothetical protein